MTTITREQLIEKLQNRIAVTANYPGVEEAQLDAAIFKIALASLEAKPIGAFHIADQQVDGTTDYIKDGEWPIDNGVIDVYAAPPASVVPETLPCSVELKPGLIIGKGCKTEILLTALKRRADYYAELEALTPEQRAEHDAGIAEFIKSFGNSEQLNSPVTPDGYALVPVEPTDEMIAAAMNCEDVLFNSDESFCVQFGNIYEAMLAAAPQPEQR